MQLLRRHKFWRLRMCGLVLLCIKAWYPKMISSFYLMLMVGYVGVQASFLLRDNLKVGLDLEMFSFIIRTKRQKKKNHKSHAVSVTAGILISEYFTLIYVRVIKTSYDCTRK